MLKTPDKTLISTKGVCLTLNGREILDGIDISVDEGEIVTIVGPNGAGKSTLVRVLLGLVPQSGGTIERARDLRVGYVPQRFAVPDTLPLTVDRLLSLTMRCKPAEREQVLEETGIGHLRASPMADLSGGELQRALIAKALLRRPNLLVLDEPVQGVDFIGEARLYRMIGDIRRDRGCGILMVSHDLHMVMAESDRVVCLNSHVCCEGKPSSVQADPEFARMFGPEAARVMAIYSHDHDHTHEGGHVCPTDGHDHKH
ncbi:MAG: metal ABC transporter ATP-binding protein [Rhizobiales bacterium]|nr:metal ABC transporter ATP-binding protein [Hyphomicrobiales bacterium]